MVHASMGDESEVLLQHAGSGRGALRWIQWNEIVVVGKLVIYTLYDTAKDTVEVAIQLICLEGRVLRIRREAKQFTIFMSEFMFGPVKEAYGLFKAAEGSKPEGFPLFTPSTGHITLS